MSAKLWASFALLVSLIDESKQARLKELKHELAALPHERVECFIAYLSKHRHRIMNYAYCQAKGISIGLGEIESTVKQIGRRMKISGAQ